MVVSGNVLDKETGQPLSSVMLSAIGAGGMVFSSTISDNTGFFSFEVPDLASSISASLLGYKGIVVGINNSSVIYMENNIPDVNKTFGKGTKIALWAAGILIAGTIIFEIFKRRDNETH